MLNELHSCYLETIALLAAIALFDPGRANLAPPLVVHLGLDQENVATPDWYQQRDHPYGQAIAAVLTQLATWPQVQKLEFMLAAGADPMTSLGVQIHRQTLSLNQLPNVFGEPLMPQTIYSVADFPSGADCPDP